MKDKISITINEKVLRDIDSIVDNLIIRNRSQAIEYLIKEALKESKIAVILAGESCKSTKKLKNRYSLIVNHLSIIERIIKKLGDSGFKTIYIIANHQTLTNIFKIVEDGSNFNVKIEFISEEFPEGTASALKLLKGKIKKTFLVVHYDVVLDNINLLELWQQHLKERKVATILASIPIIKRESQIHGHLILEGSNVLAYNEHPSLKKVGSSAFSRGIWIMEPEIFGYAGKSLEMDVFPRLAERRLLGCQMNSADHYHIHTHDDLVEVRKKIAEKR